MSNPIQSNPILKNLPNTGLTDEPKISSPDPSNCWVGGSVIALQDIVYSRSKWDFEAWRRLEVVARQEGNVDKCGSEFETQTAG